VEGVESLVNLLSHGFTAFGDPDQLRRSRNLRSAGVAGAIGSVILLALSNWVVQIGGTLSAILFTLLGASLALIGWTKLWIKESKEPFQYTYSVGEFEATDASSSGPIGRLSRDLKEKLSERVGRLSLLDEEAVPATQPGDEPASHVHISGWHCIRNKGEDWELEVVPEVRLGGAGAPARLARSVRLRLDPSNSERAPLDEHPTLTVVGYEMLFERVYWSVASEIYAQIQIGVERKVRLLPRGNLRASAYVYEAEDYATSNTLDAYSAAQGLYRRALEIYDVRYRERGATRWRRRGSKVVSWLADRRRDFRGRMAEIWRRAGRREVMTARAELGLARMLAAEWHLGRLCGIARKDIYEATSFVNRALVRLQNLPEDVPERREVLFRARVTQATIGVLLQDSPGSREALKAASRLIPTQAREDADYLFAAGMVDPDQLLSLRLCGQAVAFDPTMERALFLRAEKYDKIWRRRDSLEPEVAMTVDDAYREVIALNPGNLSAWGRRGYLGWMLAEGDAKADSSKWREHATSMLQTGRQYKEVRREASVAELDWNLTRLAAEQGDFVEAYRHYIDAVSARLGDPRIDFEKGFYLDPTEALVKRFKRYEERVVTECKRAEKKGQVPERMIRSVRAFVLNDCGLAYHAHWDRSGSGRSLTDALKAFEDAREANDSFVLPTYNLARLYMRGTELPGLSDEEADQMLSRAIDLLGDVLNREPDWSPARLLMVEAQITRTERAEKALKKAQGDGAGKDASLATQVSEGEQRIASLEEKRKQCDASAESNLRRLLPHEQLLDPGSGAHQVDAYGTKVEYLVGNDEIRWTQDFDAFHVSALGQWARLLSIAAPGAADSLCRKLRSAYCNADLTLLAAQAKAAQGRLEIDSEDEEAGETVMECLVLVQEIIRLALQEDPVHWLPLQAAAELLDKDERLERYKKAVDRGPSAAVLILIGDDAQKLEDFELAFTSFERARASGEDRIAASAALRVGDLLVDQGAGDSQAVAAYSQATGSTDAPIAAEATAKITSLLKQRGELEPAREKILEMGARPDIAEHLGPQLEREFRREEATEVYRKALAVVDDDVERVVALRIRLALLLVEGDAGMRSEGQDMIRQLLGEEIGEAKWKLRVILARSLGQTAPEEARALYEDSMKEEDPAAVALAVSELAAMMRAAGEETAAKALLREKAEASPDVAAEIERLREDEVHEDGEAPAEPAPVG
jgi:hypothetical protein